MSWLPTIRVARAAWRGSKDPAGLIKAQLTDQPAQNAATGAPAVTAPAAAIFRPLPAPVPPPPPDPVHAQLLLLLR